MSQLLKAVKVICRNRAVTLSNVAERMAISRTALYKLLERGCPTEVTFERLTNALGVPKEQLALFRKDRRKKMSVSHITNTEFIRLQASAGLTNAQTAEALGVSVQTVERWRSGSGGISKRTTITMQLLSVDDE